MKVLQTAERVSDTNPSDNFVFQRSLLAYEYARQYIQGEVLEVGSGEGYGLRILSDKSASYTMLDKYQFDPARLEGYGPNIKFIQTEVPPFKDIASNAYDCVVSFQVIEHIQNDDLFVKEIHRVLKPGGVFLATTPNIKMSLARNPWHIREYTIGQLETLMLKYFASVDKKGVFSGEKAHEYYLKNKAAVDRIMRFDIFKLQHRMPRRLLQVPYDILNRMNRKKLLKKNHELTKHLTTADFHIENANDQCLDLLFIAKK